ncbi:MAG TPA: Uma2 family endonuclease [Burkholderiaceae bacterium]|nr:Uma2 family endonuclease [Burkholderiaceae bacterium]
MSLIEELPAELGVARHRWTVDQYERMAETGLLAPDARVELIEGVIVDMAAIGSRHAATVKRLIRALTSAVGTRAILQVQDPLRLGDFSEPEPDLALLNPCDDFYASATPTAADALLVIEVAQTSAAYDRRIKLPLYATHGVPEVWIVDLDASLVHFHRQPHGERYLEITSTAAPGPTPVLLLPGVMIDLTGVL